MRRFILSAALIVMSLCFGDVATAGDFGVLGGANFYSSSVKDINAKNMTQWHAGALYKVELPVGFQLQPALLYNVKGANLNVADANLSVGYLEFMASVQWGVDLILFRPYLEVSPYAGYAVNGWGDMGYWDKTDRFEYGAGLGGGLQIWRLQLSARYNWNFQDSNFDGVSLSLAYFF